MKKLALVAILAGAGGWLAYAKVLRPAPKRACAHLHDLCNSRSDDDQSCDDFFTAIRDNSSSEDAAKTAQCVLDSRTCPEALGCTAGGAMKLGAGAARGFLDGLQKSLH